MNYFAVIRIFFSIHGSPKQTVLTWRLHSAVCVDITLSLLCSSMSTQFVLVNREFRYLELLVIMFILIYPKVDDMLAKDIAELMKLIQREEAAAAEKNKNDGPSVKGT